MSKPDAPVTFRIREMILAGELAPGERLTEAALAGLLGISRTPVRNSLPSLAAQGLLQPVGKRGYAVKEFSDKESTFALELRSLLEGQAARMVALSGASTDLIAELKSCLERGDRIFVHRKLNPSDEEEYGAMNQQFHQLIVDACDEPILKTFVARLNLVPFVAPSCVVFDQVGLPRAFEILFRAHGCHHAIVEAIQQGDGGRAESLFREHAHQQRIGMLARREKQRSRSARSVDGRS